MPKGVCDPSPLAYNTLMLSVLDNKVTITVDWAWDGVSAFPDCDGPILSVRVQNTSTVAVDVMLPNARRASGRVYTLQPGFDQTFTAKNVLRNLGYETIKDMDDLTIVEV